MKTVVYIFLFILPVFSMAQAEKADKIYFNASIWTGNEQMPGASAIAINGNKIIFVGNDYQLYIGDRTELIDIKNKFLIPGFIDNHTHFLSGGYNLSGVDLRKETTKQEFINALKVFCRLHNDDRWILGGDWDHETWGGALPEKEWIDSITGNHPVFVNRYDGHMAFANSKALHMAGITSTTQAPPGGEIIKNKNGEPTGMLKDEAMALMNRIIPDPSEQEFDEYFSAAQQYAFENGVTQVHDMGSYGGWTDLKTYRRNYKQKKLQLRIYSFVALWSWKKLDSFCKKNGKGDDMLRWGGLKGFVDGSLGSTTAWFYQPYLDAPGNTGLQVTDTALLRKWVLAADSAGLQVAVHAIGDRANDFIMNVYEEAEKVNPDRDRRFRIEHAQHLTPSAITRFAKLNIIASVQPYHAIDDGRWAYKRLEDARLKGTYVFRSLLDAKAVVTFGSDWTVAPMKPIEGIYAAVTRRTLDGKNPNGWYPEQKISVEQALKCYTQNNAFAGFQDNKLGILKKGMLADFVVLSDNLFEIAPEKMLDVKVLRTVIGGKDVYVKK
ncbi:MAG: amidohydrolase [Bacteroidetes bacterium]|nr:amidohydrolase [Bacteroidota bacterium]MBS1931484.1 amidohydrolase [Bacteroidota bacterium]